MSKPKSSSKKSKSVPVAMDIPPRSAKSSTRFDRAKTAAKNEPLFQEDQSLVPPAAMAVHAMLEAELQEDQAKSEPAPTSAVVKDQPKMKILKDQSASVVPVVNIEEKIKTLLPPFMANRKR